MFLSNVAYHLEDGKWGNVYPMLMNKLYKGELPVANVENAINELQKIKAQFKLVMPDQAIWEIEYPARKSPFAGDTAQRITDLSNYFYTSDARDLFDVIQTTLETALKVKKNVAVQSI
ncbi:Imm70 family immunity protein [Pedobacter lithocola]|uniref:Imm70 family immunity protein n=1 Tax=Pedobacter lithocola TaxID=1908239 RepID=A0ABV8PBV8_9SPHI